MKRVIKMVCAENTSKSNAKDLLKELSALNGISSNEKIVSDKINLYLSNICDKTQKDARGNLIGFIKCTNSSDCKTLLLEAHMDQIGLMVTKICSDGTLKFTNIGGVDERTLSFSKVFVSERKIEGIIVPDKKSDNSEINGKSIDTTDNLKIETGLTYDEAKEKIKIGDLIILASEYTELCNNVVSGGAFDNRAGIVSILLFLKDINREKLEYNITILFSVQEETGMFGAYYAGGKLGQAIDAAIVIDVTHGETNDTRNMSCVFSLGSGAVICRGPNLHYDYTKQLIAVAKENNIPYKIEVAAGSSGTDAWALQTSSVGLPCMLVSIPLRYMHSSVETLDIKDIEIISKLLLKVAEGGIKI